MEDGKLDGMEGERWDGMEGRFDPDTEIDGIEGRLGVEAEGVDKVGGIDVEIEGLNGDGPLALLDPTNGIDSGVPSDGDPAACPAEEGGKLGLDTGSDDRCVCERNARVLGSSGDPGPEEGGRSAREGVPSEAEDAEGGMCRFGGRWCFSAGASSGDASGLSRFLRAGRGAGMLVVDSWSWEASRISKSTDSEERAALGSHSWRSTASRLSLIHI